MSNQTLLQTKALPAKTPIVQPKQDRSAITRQAAPARMNAAQLQRSFGNQALGQLAGRLTIQTKLTLGAVGDRYEQEADQVAHQVVQQMNTTPAAAGTAQGSTVQREMPQEEEKQPPGVQASFLQRADAPQLEDEEHKMAKSPMPTIQRATAEEDQLQQKPLIQRTGGMEGGAVDPAIESAIQSKRGNGSALPDGVRAPMERAFGADFSGVNVHTSDESHALNQQLQARAFTTGKDIFFRQGEYNPSSTGGQELLAHELTHVVQQTGKG